MKQTVNLYFREHPFRIFAWILCTAVVSFLAPLKAFQLKWLIDSTSKQEAFRYLALVFLITISSWAFETLSRQSFTGIACCASQSVRNQVMSQLLRRPMMDAGKDAECLSLLTTDIRTLYDDYYTSIFNIVFWGGILIVCIIISAR